MKTMDKILLILCVLTLAFTVTMIVCFFRFQMVPDTLISVWFGTVVGECGVMGWIKTAKVRHQDRAWQIEDEKRMEEREHGSDR